MKYLVMETHFSYAIVLDDGGRFIKCANFDYQVGDKVSDIVAMAPIERLPKPSLLKKLKKYFWVPTLATALALILVISGVIQHYTTFASVYLAINPEVRIDINQSETVIGLAGMNLDGEHLVEGYPYKRKHLDTVMNELIDRAIDEGYLSEGGKVRVDLATYDAEWQKQAQPIVRDNIKQHLKDRINIRIEIDGDLSEDDDAPGKIIIPIEPRPEPAPPVYDDSEYDQDSDYEIEAPTPTLPDDDSDYDDVYEWDDSEYEDSEFDD